MLKEKEKEFEEEKNIFTEYFSAGIVTIMIIFAIYFIFIFFKLFILSAFCISLICLLGFISVNILKLIAKFCHKNNKK